MPSSTSSSRGASSRGAARGAAPAGPWGRTWLVALAAALLGLGGWEACWRARGFAPALPDDARLWVQERSRASSGSRDTVVLLGSSIVQAAVDLDLYARESGGPEPIQLGLTGSSPLPILEDLAADPRFVGIAIAEVSPLGLFDATDTSEALPRAMLQHERAARVGPGQGSEARLRSLVEEYAVFRLSVLAPAYLAQLALHRDLPRVNPLRMGRDRAIRFDFSERTTLVPPALGRAAHGLAPVVSGAAFEQVLERMAAATRAIRQRGGVVALLSLECDGPYRKEVARRYPLGRYWAPLVDRSGALPLDLAAAPELRGIRCPDGVHIDAGSRAAFTAVLAREVTAGVTRPRR